MYIYAMAYVSRRSTGSIESQSWLSMLGSLYAAKMICKEELA